MTVTPNPPLQPVLFVSHGSPMFALEHGTTAPALQAWAAGLATQPRGIVIMSPHWMARTPMVMTTVLPATWHDFGGFDPALQQIQYPAPGDPALAQQVLALLHAAGIPAQGDAQRPLDHGAWVPLMHLFPKANVPVVQLALPTDYTPQSLVAMADGRANSRPMHRPACRPATATTQTSHRGRTRGRGSLWHPRAQRTMAAYASHREWQDLYQTFASCLRKAPRKCGNQV